MAFHIGQLTRRELLIATGFVIASNALGALPAVVIGADTSWIDRPWFFPPEILFPIVWTALFTLMGISVFIVWHRGDPEGERTIALGVFAIQFGLNMAWTPAFFGLENPGLGLGVIALLWVTIIATIIVFDRISRLAGVLLVPYLAWVSFALVLNYAIYAGIGS